MSATILIPFLITFPGGGDAHMRSQKGFSQPVFVTTAVLLSCFSKLISLFTRIDSNFPINWGLVYYSDIEHLPPNAKRLFFPNLN